MSDKNLYTKYREYLNKSGEMYSTHGERSYCAGYELAQKEMEARLKEAIEVIKSVKNCEIDVHGIAVRFLNKIEINSLNKALHGLNLEKWK